MKGVILSGGKGLRLAPITKVYPKQLLPVIGKPILLHCIENLTSSGITEIAIIVGQDKGKLIEDEVNSYQLGLNIKFIYQDEPKGLAHAIGLAREFTGNDSFVVLLGDNLFDKKLFSLVENFRKSKPDTLILLKDVSNPYDFGVVKFDDNGYAVSLVEKPKEFVSNFAIVGVYLFNKKIYEAIDEVKPSARGELEITDAIALQVHKGLKVKTEQLDSFWYDTGTRDGMIDANRRMLLYASKVENLSNKISNSHLFGKLIVGKNSSIENSNLMGPIFIGKNVKIINSTIGPYTSISDNSVIENSEIQSSILMKGTSVLDSNLVSSIVFKDSRIFKEQILLNQIYMRNVEPKKLFMASKPIYSNIHV